MHLFRQYNTSQVPGRTYGQGRGTVICLRALWLIGFFMHVLNLYFRWPRDKRPHNYCPIDPSSITTRFNPDPGDEERHRLSPSSSSGQSHAWTSDLLVALCVYKLYHSSSSGTFEYTSTLSYSWRHASSMIFFLKTANDDMCVVCGESHIHGSIIGEKLKAIQRRWRGRIILRLIEILRNTV